MNMMDLHLSIDLALGMVRKESRMLRVTKSSLIDGAVDIWTTFSPLAKQEPVEY